jgi:hypothetical protein
MPACFNVGAEELLCREKKRLAVLLHRAVAEVVTVPVEVAESLQDEFLRPMADVAPRDAGRKAYVCQPRGGGGSLHGAEQARSGIRKRAAGASGGAVGKASTGGRAARCRHNIVV